jgi:Flp pilus assembly protein TadD
VLSSLIRDHPELREAQLQFALLDVEEKHYAEAEARFRKYYQPGKGDVRSLEGLVELYRAQNRLGSAVDVLRLDLEKGPQFNDVRVLLAKTAAQAGQNDLAASAYEEAARVQPNSPAIAIGFGLACQSRGDYPRAIAEFARAEKLDPAEGLPSAYLGRALDESGHPQEAILSYRRSLARESHDPWVMNNLAYLLAERGGDLNEAFRLADAAVRVNPGNPLFNDTLGWVYFRKKDYASAIQIFSGVRDKSPGDVEFRIHLSRALLASGDRNRVSGELLAAKALPCSPAQREQINRLIAEAGQPALKY